MASHWWDTAGLGIIIHWGVYSVTAFHKHPTPPPKIDNGSEWYLKRLNNPGYYGAETKTHHLNAFPGRSYYDLADDLNKAVEQWDPTALAELCCQAGARYVIITAKHHDGFCMWPTTKPSVIHKGQPWALKRDVLMELKTSLEAKGIKFGLYYSLYEWERKDTTYVATTMIPQMLELLERYRPEVWWSDGDWAQSAEHWYSELFIKLYRLKVPTGIINDRWGKGARLGDYKTGQDRLVKGQGRWEGVHPIGQGWAYNICQPNYKTPIDIYRLYHQVRQAGGNLLLGIGPKPDGSLPAAEVHVLKTWLYTDPLWLWSLEQLQALAAAYGLKGTTTAELIAVLRSIK